MRISERLTQMIYCMQSKFFDFNDNETFCRQNPFERWFAFVVASIALLRIASPASLSSVRIFYRMCTKTTQTIVLLGIVA